MLVACATFMVLDSAISRRPLPQPRKDDVVVAAAGEAGATAGVDVIALTSAAERSLRQTLVEPKPVEVPAPKAPPPPPPVEAPKLLATFVEQGEAWGLFVDRQGGQRVRRASERIAEFEIVGISPGSATLRRGADNVEVSVPVRNAMRTKRKSSR